MPRRRRHGEEEALRGSDQPLRSWPDLTVGGHRSAAAMPGWYFQGLITPSCRGVAQSGPTRQLPTATPSSPRLGSAGGCRNGGRGPSSGSGSPRSASRAGCGLGDVRHHLRRPLDTVEGVIVDTSGQLVVGTALVGSVLRFNAMQLMGAVGVGIAAGAATGLVGTAIV